MYTIYGSNNCCQCSMVKRLFNEKGLEYNYVDIKDAPEIKQKATDKIGRASCRERVCLRV